MSIIRYEGHNIVVESSLYIGSVGFRRSGTKVHVVRAERIIEVIDPEQEHKGTIGHKFLREQARPESVRRPVFWSAGSWCNGNGQHVGSPGEPLTDSNREQVTCEKCRKRLGL